MTVEFEAWPKIPRLNRPVVVTEKLDGTNAAVIIDGPGPPYPDIESGKKVEHLPAIYVVVDDQAYFVAAQSRKRLITPEDDNHSFAAWVFDNATELARVLGPGRHFGEWWGNGIQRGYGLKQGDKRFSLFNTKRWDVLSEKSEDQPLGVLEDWTKAPGLRVVPTVAQLDTFDTDGIRDAVELLRKDGSFAVPGYNRPEGVVVYHTAGNNLFKVMLEGDDIPKSEPPGRGSGNIAIDVSDLFDPNQVINVTVPPGFYAKAMETRAQYA